MICSPTVADPTPALIECVPNFSEGRDKTVIRRIVESITSVGDGVRLLHVDAGEAANRTVITFCGTPEAVTEAAFRAVGCAAELIDMRRQHGTHPRIGATDVLPLVPLHGITLAECAELARQLARRIADELRIPCYCYEAAALKPEHRNLATCRAGEYEQLPQKLADPLLAPDYGTRPFDEGIARTGCTVVGARPVLLAVNFNLNSTSAHVAAEIAKDVRERGRGNGRPGTLRCVKAIGWYIDEYGIAQVSMNITDLSVTPLHMAWEEVCRCAAVRGVTVTGTEIIGLVPRHSLIEAGRFYREKNHLPPSADEEEILADAVGYLGLADLRPFNMSEKLIPEQP